MLRGCDTLLLDGRHGCVAARFAREARERGINVIMDTETSDRPHFADMLKEATVVVTNATFPQSETKEDDLLFAMASLMCGKAAAARVLITTRGSEGCLAMERCNGQASVDLKRVCSEKQLYESAAPGVDYEQFLFECRGASWVVHLRRAILIPREMVRDTTGAGDSFVGTVAYGVTKGFSLRKTLDLATYVASCKCKGVGSHGGVPRIDEIPKEYL